MTRDARYWMQQSLDRLVAERDALLDEGDDDDLRVLELEGEIKNIQAALASVEKTREGPPTGPQIPMIGGDPPTGGFRPGDYANAPTSRFSPQRMVLVDTATGAHIPWPQTQPQTPPWKFIGVVMIVAFTIGFLAVGTIFALQSLRGRRVETTSPSGRLIPANDAASSAHETPDRSDDAPKAPEPAS